MSYFTIAFIIDLIGLVILLSVARTAWLRGKELQELKIKHKVTMSFADKLSKKLLALEKESRRVKSNGAISNNGASKEKKAPYKKTRRSKKKSSPKSSNSGSAK